MPCHRAATPTITIWDIAVAADQMARKLLRNPRESAQLAEEITRLLLARYAKNVVLS